MTDAEYTFRQTEIERKRSGRGAFYKKNGSRSKKCSLPSDRLTAKQRKELNGKMETYNLDKPMNWIQFLQMPRDLQKEYLTNLVSYYGARRVDLLAMFGVSNSAFQRFMAAEFPDLTLWGKAGPHKPSDVWLIFIDSDETLPEEVSQPTEEENCAPEPCESVKQANLTEVRSVMLEINSGTLRYTGDPHAIFTKALLALDTSKDYRITIIFDSDMDEEDGE